MLVGIHPKKDTQAAVLTLQCGWFIHTRDLGRQADLMESVMRHFAFGVEGRAANTLSNSSPSIRQHQLSKPYVRGSQGRRPTTSLAETGYLP